MTAAADADATASLGEPAPATLALDRGELERGQQELAGVAARFEQQTQPRLGHYRLGERLGAGGMGTVFAAYDEKLARKVAIKLMRRRSREADQRRFVREAQAMARLSHPNVVQVYEIGEAEGVTFIVMELVDGVTLSTWMRDRGRTRDEILTVFAAAGRGLIAAHEAGLVHRDFKPANVLIGRDGRVLVTDFGLARTRGLDSAVGPDEGADADPPSPSSGELEAITRIGAVVGTPAYMAPEQFLGREVGPRADQFSCCVALWEACFGARPFAGADFDQLAIAVTNGRILRDPGVGPSWLLRALERGLHVDPERRWPSLAALLDHLRQRTRRESRRRWLVAATVGLALAGGGLGLGFDTRAEAQVRAECAAQAAGLAEVWNPEIAAEIDARIASAPLAYVQTSWPRARARMDAFAADWAEVAQRSCLAARVEGRTSLATWARVEECLDARRAGFAALVELRREGDDPAIAGTLISAATELIPPDTCTRDSTRLEPIPPAKDLATDLATWIGIREVRAQLVQAEALRQVGCYEAGHEPGHELARAAVTAAERVGWQPLVAEARLELGDQLEDLGRYPEARDAKVAAFLDASESGHELIALRAAGDVGFLVGNRLADPERGRVWVELAARLLVRHGLEGSLRGASVYEQRGLVLYQAREFALAESDARRAHALRVELLGEDHPSVGIALGHIGITRSSQRDLEGALEYTQRAVSSAERAYGPLHPELARVLNNHAVMLTSLRRWDEAIAAYERVLTIWDAGFEREHVAKGAAYYGLGLALEGKGELEQALANFERSRALQIETNPDDPNLEYPLVAIARVAGRLGDHPRAVDALERTLELRGAAGADPDALAGLHFDLARALDHVGEPERARALALEARERYAVREPAAHERLAEIDAWLAERR